MLSLHCSFFPDCLAEFGWRESLCFRSPLFGPGEQGIPTLCTCELTVLGSFWILMTCCCKAWSSSPLYGPIEAKVCRDKGDCDFVISTPMEAIGLGRLLHGRFTMGLRSLLLLGARLAVFILASRLRAIPWPSSYGGWSAAGLEYAQGLDLSLGSLFSEANCFSFLDVCLLSIGLGIFSLWTDSRWLHEISVWFLYLVPLILSYRKKIGVHLGPSFSSFDVEGCVF